MNLRRQPVEAVELQLDVSMIAEAEALGLDPAAVRIGPVGRLESRALPMRAADPIFAGA